MSNDKFDEEAKKMLSNAPKPDAEAGIIKEIPEKEETKPEPKRDYKAEYKRRKTGGGRKKKSASGKNTTDDVYYKSARAVNAIVFTSACAVTGTGAAFPPDEKAEVMDRALERYFELKDITVAPELILLAAYGEYLKHLTTDEEVVASASKRFGWVKRIGWVNKIFSKFRRNKAHIEEVKEKKEKKGWIK
jgi:hypothetical protein